MEHIITKEEMTGMKALAETSMKISEAKGILFKLQETETAYLIEREKKAIVKIQQSFEQSQNLINETNENYEEVRRFYKIVSSFSEGLTGIYDKFEVIVKDFSERTEAWENKINTQQDEILEKTKEIKEERVKMENERKNLIKKETSLKNLETHLSSRQSTLEKSYEIEKKLWTKLNK